MNVLFVASECAPFVKTGGLADVVGAVPKALASYGTSVRVLLPAYPALASQLEAATSVLEFANLQGGPARLVQVQSQGIDLLLLDAPHLYDRPGSIYLDTNNQDWPDNALRYGALCFAGATIAQQGVTDKNGKHWLPDLVHAHDWQAGLLPAYLKQTAKPSPPVVMTVHNIAFQGLFDKSLITPLGLSPDLYTPEGAEFYGRLGFLKAGLALGEHITTVSPTYARELMSAEFGMGLEGLVTARASDLTGILNGIDTTVWDPETDPLLHSNYTIDTIQRKTANREFLQQRFNLHADPEALLFCVISRLTEQKGFDMLLQCLPNLIDRGAQLALLGSGDKRLEEAFSAAASRFAGSVGVVTGYDEALAHQLQGGSDAILIPSRFEPCGLTQLYGLRYGTVPVVARTGGLADTVIDANDAALGAGCATGFQFSPINAESLAQAIDRACDLFQDKTAWASVRSNGMRHSVGWETAAGDYHALYQSAVTSSRT